MKKTSECSRKVRIWRGNLTHILMKFKSVQSMRGKIHYARCYCFTHGSRIQWNDISCVVMWLCYVWIWDSNGFEDITAVFISSIYSCWLQMQFAKYEASVGFCFMRDRRPKRRFCGEEMPRQMVIERAGEILDAGELTLVSSGKNNSSEVCVRLKWALFFDGEPSNVSVLWATWIPGAGSLDCLVFLIKPGRDWQDQDCSRSLFLTFSFNLSLLSQCCCYHRAEYHHIWLSFSLKHELRTSNELLSFSRSFGSRTYVKAILEMVERTLITESHSTHDAFHRLYRCTIKTSL